LSVVTKEEYASYLKSPEWKARREAALEAALWACQVCNRDSALQVHHRCYERVGEERQEDLIVLCDDCHGLFHRRSSVKGSRPKRRRRRSRGSKRRGKVSELAQAERRRRALEEPDIPDWRLEEAA
jgi:5-methylcytosine-specific restriction endonuclease McrA